MRLHRRPCNNEALYGHARSHALVVAAYHQEHARQDQCKKATVRKLFTVMDIFLEVFIIRPESQTR